MGTFDEALAYVLKWEGGLSENPNDPGGITNHGISLRFLKSLSEENLLKYDINPEIDENTVKQLSDIQTRNIYCHEFWNSAPFSLISNQEQCDYIFDMVVNMGLAPAIKCVQRAAWAVLKRHDILKEDGKLGNDTIAAIHQCGFMLMAPLRAERANHYRTLVLINPVLEKFFNGWLNRTYKCR